MPIRSKLTRSGDTTTYPAHTTPMSGKTSFANTPLTGANSTPRELEANRALPALGATRTGSQNIGANSRASRLPTHEFSVKPPPETDEQIKRRLKLTQAVATQLMKAAVDRQPNVLPIFSNDPETRGLCLIDEERRSRTERKPLAAPCLGIAAGVNAMGGYSARYAMSTRTAEQWIARERASNRVLFSWWEERNAVRHEEEEMAAVEEELRGPVQSCFRQCLTEAEVTELEAARHAQEAAVGQAVERGIGRPGGLSTALTLSATERGIRMPVEVYEELFRRVMGRVHRRFLALLRCLGADAGEGMEMPLASRAQGSKYVRHLLKSHVEALEAFKVVEGGKALSLAGEAISGMERVRSVEVEEGTTHAIGNEFYETDEEEDVFFERYPPHVAVPEDRCFRPLLGLETAFAAALLWRILDQARDVMPTMGWAMQLFNRYVMPHVYENFAPTAQLLPRAGSIGEQVEQLYALKLNVLRQRSSVVAATQAKKDVRYMELAMKSWSWRSWRQSVVGRKRHDILLDRIDKTFKRFHELVYLKKCFSEWRLTAKEGRFVAQLDDIDARYGRFLGGAQHAAREVRLFPDLGDGAIDPPSTIVDKNKFIALKLAETAEHHKAKRRKLTQRPLTGETNRSDNDTDTNDKDRVDDSVKEQAKLEGSAKGSEDKGGEKFGKPVEGKTFKTNLEDSSTHERRRSPKKATALSWTDDSSTQQQQVQQQQQQQQQRHSSPTREQAVESSNKTAEHAAQAVTRVTTPSLHGGLTPQESILSGDAHATMKTPDAFMTGVEPTPVPTEDDPLQGRALGTFEDMLRKLQEMESISGYLRQEIAIQNKIIQKLERENKNMKEKTNSLETSLHDSEEERLRLSNLLQERQLDAWEFERRILQLKSRLRCQRQRPWQKTVLRVVGEVCGASTSAAEYDDEVRVARNMRSSTTTKESTAKVLEAKLPSPSESGAPAAVPSIAGGTTTPVPFAALSGSTEVQRNLEESDGGTGENAAYLPEPTPDEERLFSQLAPIVLSSTRDMPDAQTILRDWANGCLNDLESLDDLKGGAISNRFLHFSDEMRNGVLLSRLLFYLALPRYQNKTAVARNTPGGGQEVRRRRGSVAPQDFTDHRRQLLFQHNVQLDSPFPTYSDCFGDLLNLKPSGRMSLLLQFATELMEGPEQLGDEHIQKRMARIRETALKVTEMVPLPAAHRVEMQEIIDPYALSRGDRSASITLIALLYVRFSHPFNHKARHSALIEREEMLWLLSDGSHRHRIVEPNSASDCESASCVDHNASPAPESSTSKDVPDPSRSDAEGPVARELLSQLEEEERSPWQLFLRHCKPLINTLAHPFILRGNFWPSVAFDSPELARMLGALGLALHRSLQEHRWHVIVSCLVPVHTYSGLSRGIFTGRRASPIALQAGLERDGDWNFAFGMPCVQTILQERESAIRAAVEEGKASTKLVASEAENDALYNYEKGQLMNSLGTCSNDLLQIFLQHSSLASSCAMPALDLGSWRLLWIDFGLVNPEEPETSLVDLEQLTRIFYVVSVAVVEHRKETRRETIVDASIVDQWSVTSMPPFNGGLFFPEFLAAVVLLAHEMYPPVNPEADTNKKVKIMLEHSGIVWIGDAMRQLIFTHIAPRSLINTIEDPSSVPKRLSAGVKTQEVLLRHNKALLIIFGAYCKDVCGVSGMEREPLLQLLRDAMLTSTEISQNLIFELFAPCSSAKKTEDSLKEEKRREQDARPRDAVQRRRANVSILEPTSDQNAVAVKQKEFTVLLYDGFLQFLCLLCHFKQPNPLIPFEQRLDTFLRRGLMRPLSNRIDSLANVLSYERQQTKQPDPV